MFKLLICSYQAIPAVLNMSNPPSSKPNVVIYDLGETRYSLFAGKVNQNDALTACPYTDEFEYIPDVPAKHAAQIVGLLNGGSSSSKRSFEVNDDDNYYKSGRVERRYQSWLREMSRRHSEIGKRGVEDDNLTLGYVTHDVRVFFIISDVLLNLKIGRAHV